jgi:predicted AAA+ superfamily ATPase
MEEAYLIRRLQPYYINIRKRLVKSPKVFWRDSGLLHNLLGVLTIIETI